MASINPTKAVSSPLAPQEARPAAGEKPITPTRLKRYGLGWGGPALIVSVFLALTAWTWRKWPDLLIDFGRELYIPWQLLQGKVLYRDLAYLNGPLSPYLNALWFKIFGVSLTTLIFCNLAILALITWLIYYIVKRSCDGIAAILACLTFLGIFAFGHIIKVGNYNYVCPYSHELTHGLLLSLALIIFLSGCISRLRYSLIILSGLSLGLIFLGKGEVFLGAALAAALGFLLISLANQLTGRKVLRVLGTFTLAMLIPPTLFFVYFYHKMPPEQALRGLAGTWAGLLGSNVQHSFFYKFYSGFDRPWPNFLKMVGDFFLILLGAGAVIGSENFSKRAGSRLLKVSLGLALLLGVFLLVKKSLDGSFILFNRSLPLTALTLASIVLVLSLRKRRDRAALEKLGPLALLAALGLGLLAKIMLNAHVGHYGFALAMPASILLVAGLVGLMPEILRKYQFRSHWFLLLAVVLIALDLMLALQYSYLNYSRKDFWVGDRGDSFKTYGPQFDPRGYGVAQLLEYIKAAVPARASMAVLPEGVMVNYLSRHPNPTPYSNFMPPEMEIFGEGAILKAFKQHPPDYVILIHKDTREYGVGNFGTGPNYGKDITDWIKGHYEPVWRIMDEPLRDEKFGIKMLKWNATG